MWGNGCQVKELNILCWEFNLKRNCFPVSLVQFFLLLLLLCSGVKNEEMEEKRMAIKIGKNAILIASLVSQCTTLQSI